MSLYFRQKILCPMRQGKAANLWSVRLLLLYDIVDCFIFPMTMGVAQPESNLGGKEELRSLVAT